MLAVVPSDIFGLKIVTQVMPDRCPVWRARLTANLDLLKMMLSD